jgi:integrase
VKIMAGYIEKRGKNSYRLNYSKDNNLCRKLIHCNSEREAKKELAKFVAEIENGTYISNPNLTFKEYVERWLSDYAKPTLAPKTFVEYHKKELAQPPSRNFFTNEHSIM